MKKALLSVLAVALLISIAGCSTTPAAIVLSGEQRITAPNVTTSDATALVDGNSEFAFDLFQALNQQQRNLSQQGNLFYSPYSISLALAMTYAGARNETATEMAQVLHFTLPQDRLHPAFNGLDLALANRSETGNSFQLHIVNAIWGQKGYKFLDSFLNVLGRNYGAGLRLLDFANQSETSRATINDWVSDQTKGKINDLLPQGSIDALTRLVLTNAIYFNASWLSSFNERLTSNGTFHLIDGDTVTVPMMKQTHFFVYVSGDGYQAVELPYNGSKLSMVILLPDSGKFETFENKLNASFASRIISDLKYCEVDLTLPKFKYEYECSLANTLAAMSMPKAFSGDADFSGMTGNRDLAISDVIHKAYVSVDEAGTEAAAATAVTMAGAMPGEPAQMTVDHPFIFLIRDIDTGTILFIGRVMNPNP
jgi:serpin B